MNLSGASVLLGLVVVAAVDWRVAVGMAAIGAGIWWWMRH
ncbi:hypothetical protein ABIC63_002139 [Pseudacidovorax sp. 1753]